MSAHGVDVFNFEFWEGTPPVLVQEQVTTHTRPGTDGVGQVKSGVWEQPFTSKLTSDHDSYVNAMAGFSLMRSITGTGWVQVKWNNLNMLGLFGHVYFVDRVRLISCRTHPRLMGPGYDFLGGARLITEWSFTPHAQ